jgi:ABC-type Na+ transport system ATPase subunit NatA
MISAGPGYFMDPRYWPNCWSSRVYAVHVMRDVVRKTDHYFVCTRKGEVVEVDSVEAIDAWVKVVDRLERDEVQAYEARAPYSGVLR